MRRQTKAILALFFLSPFIGEMLSGSSPPLEFFSPFGLTLMCLLYGGGALIIRELTVIWGKGWISILLMAAAYGIIEEGLMVKSFFDPHWQDIGTLGEYGRFLDVNWVWTTMLIAYHCVFSIAIPILLVNLAYPDQAGKRWLTDKGLRRLAYAFVADIVFGFIFLTPYYPGPVEYSWAIGAVLVLFLLAKWVSPHPFDIGGRLARPRRFYFLGAFYGTGLFMSGWALPGNGVSPVVPMLSIAVLSAICFIAVLLWSDSGRQWDGRHQHALASGVLSFLIFMALVLQGAVFGMPIVAIFTIALLVLMWRKLSLSKKMEQLRTANFGQFTP